MIDGRSVAVVGFGSIGQRHARIIDEMGLTPLIVSRRAEIDAGEVASIADAFAEPKRPAAWVIANETGLHLETLAAIRNAGFAGPVLIEKPLSVTSALADVVEPSWRMQTFIAYNLRFHPAIRRLRDRIAGKSVLSATLRVGQDLRTWRGDRDVASSYSASRADGGGVLRDLSHELDFFRWLFGDWTRVTALGGRLGTLTIDSDDTWSILIEADRCRCGAIQLDYHNRWPTRTVAVQFEDDTVEVDLITGRIRDGSSDGIVEVVRDHSYRAQLEAFLNGIDAQSLCGYDDGLATLRLIEAIEVAADSQAWVER